MPIKYTKKAQGQKEDIINKYSNLKDAIDRLQNVILHEPNKIHTERTINLENEHIHYFLEVAPPLLCQKY